MEEKEEEKLGGEYLGKILLGTRETNCGYDHISLYICMKFSRNLF